MRQLIQLDAGSGGRASQRLIQAIFYKYLQNDILASMNDAALLPAQTRPMSMSTDSYTVTPLVFPGGNIGDLAVNGTVNDIAMLGATPLWLSAGFIIEEGLPVATLETVVQAMAKACQTANVKIVTGDTKVVPRGACDGLFINTAGIGDVYAATPPSGDRAEPGDAVILSGAIGDHGLTIMAARAEVTFLTDVSSDSAPLADMIRAVIEAAAPVHVLRDPTRGGLATTLNEIAVQSGVSIEVDEKAIPIHAAVSDGCSFIGLDPLYLANEGKCVCILPEERADAALRTMRASPYGREAAIIGRVTEKSRGRVVLRTMIGGERLLAMLEGDQLPRIC